MIGVALWHLSVLVSDRFYGGVIGALLAAIGGALASGYLLPVPGIPPHNPPGITEVLWPIPGALLALLATYAYGARRERTQRTPAPIVGFFTAGGLFATAMGVTPPVMLTFGPRQSRHARIL
jgi:hypothetical protein